MLSNQMRGRAIRVFKPNPDKTSNIWHLVCLPDERDLNDKSYNNISEDYALLKRRMEHFLGLHYEVDVIESGIGRLSIITPPFDAAHVAEMNQQMLTISGQRALLKDRWNRSLSLHKTMDIVEETEVAAETIPTAVFKASATGLMGALICLGILFIFKGFFVEIGMKDLFNIAVYANILYGLSRLPKVLQLRNAPKRLKAFGNGIRKALLVQGLLEGAGSKVEVESNDMGTQCVYLSGGTGRDKALFTKCVKELFGVIDNQRYILVKQGAFRGENSFYAVPECFGKKREDAEKFFACIKPYIGKFDLVYTRNETGRQLLLEGRMKALANKNSKNHSRKKLKNKF